MCAKRKSKSSYGDNGVLGGFFDQFEEYTPDPHDYSFLTEQPLDFSIKKHAALLGKLIDKLDDPDSPLWDHHLFSRETAESIAPLIRRAIGLKANQDILITESLFPRFASRPVNPSLVFSISMVIAGNINILNEDQVIVQHYDLKHPVWIPMTITDMKDSDRSGVFRVSFFADAGIFAGSTTIKNMSVKFIRFVLREIGMPRRTPMETRDLFGTKLSVLISKAGGAAEFGKFDTSGPQLNYNRDLFRVRHGDRPCHMDMLCTCSDCIYGTDMCDFAVYKTTEVNNEKETTD